MQIQHVVVVAAADRNFFFLVLVLFFAAGRFLGDVAAGGCFRAAIREDRLFCGEFDGFAVVAVVVDAGEEFISTPAAAAVFAVEE
jgi:hypothetical protein